MERSKKKVTKIITIALPLETHTNLKMAAAASQITLKDYVIQAIEQAVEKGGEKKK